MRVLFDPNSEYAALFPQQATLLQAIAALNAAGVPPAVYAEDELLGWVYQYYNSAEKDAVYARLSKGKKLERPEELAAATCLYTERYMVDYLLQNTLGALWVELHPRTRLRQGWPYYVMPPESEARPARAPRRLRDITLIDPACGSGHFLVRAFDLLAAMYREEGIEPEGEIAGLILECNLYGIDIDLRAVQLAALALYLKGCALAGPEFRPRRLNLIPADAALPPEPPTPTMSCFGGDKELDTVMRGVWADLRRVREFGSLLHPERAIDQLVERRQAREQGGSVERSDADWQAWKGELLRGLREEFEREAQSEDLGRRLFGEDAAKGIGLVEALGREYDVVVANPPYQGTNAFRDDVVRFIQREYPLGKDDIYAAFILRCLNFAVHGGSIGMVTRTWLFLDSFAALRWHLLQQTRITTIAH